jgi:hypothetical protein
MDRRQSLALLASILGQGRLPGEHPELSLEAEGCPQ